jgi:hypothetical protein
MAFAASGSSRGQKQIAEILLTKSDPVSTISGPIIVEIDLVNMSTSDVRILETNPDKEYVLVLQGPGRRPVPLTSYGKEMSDPQGPLDRNFAMVLKPKEQSPPVRVDLRKLFEIAQPGEYHVSGTRGVYSLGSETSVLIHSNELTIRLTQ